MDEIERHVRENYDSIQRERRIQQEVARQRTVRGEREITRTHAVLVALALIIVGIIWAIHALAHAHAAVIIGIAVAVALLGLIIALIVAANRRERNREEGQGAR